MEKYRLFVLLWLCLSVQMLLRAQGYSMSGESPYHFSSAYFLTLQDVDGESVNDLYAGTPNAVGAFVNGELRGVSEPVYLDNADGCQAFFIRVWGDENDPDVVTFRIRDIDNGLEYEFGQQQFGQGQDVTFGAPSSPVMMTFVPIEGVSLSTGDFSLMRGTTAKVAATVYPENHSSLMSDTSIGYVSSDDGVFTVLPDGTVSAHSNGTATLTATLYASGNPVFSTQVSVSVYSIKVADVVIDYHNHVLTMSCSTEDAVIHYTVDGTVPTGDSPVYTTPLTMTRNCQVKAVALKQNYDDSNVTVYEVDDFKVADVMFAFKSQHIELSTPTEDAVIYYTTDGTVPTAENIETACTKYEAPVSLRTDCMVRAIAIREGYHPSEVTAYPFVLANVTVATPEIAVTDGMVTIVCATSESTIYYTLDGTDPTTESLRYEEPFVVSDNAVIKAFAVHADFLPSAIGEYVISDMFKTDVPTFVRNGNVLTIQAAEGDKVFYAFEDGEYVGYTVPVTLTDNRTVSAYATRNGYLPSDVATYTVDWFACADVKVGYDGRSLTLSSTDGATIYYTLDDSEPTATSAVYEQPIGISGFATVKAMAVKQYLNPSAVTTYEVPTYFDGGESVEVKTAGTLSSAFDWLDGSEIPEKLTITGNLNQDDLRFLRSINGLRHLNLSGANMTGGRLPDAAFANMNVISIEIPVSITGTGNNLFIGCTRLAAIVWGAGIAATEEAMSGLNNPNLLFYVNRKVYAPQSIRNVVTDGVAQNIELSDAETDGNFYCPRYFFAERISYVHNFTLESGKNKVAAGWESLALPFDVQKVEHEENGMLVPFTVYNNLSSDEKEVTKPYWLYTMDSEGSAFKPTERIVANTPYIICMPNNADYADNYNQRGNVTFSAQGINVAPTELKPMEHGTVRFVPCFEHIAQSRTVSLLNLEAIGMDLPGSVFYPNLRDARPFEAYIMDVIRPNLVMRVFDNNDTGIDVIPMLKHGIVFENEKVYNLNGLRVKTPGKGVYIVNGKKVLIK